MYRKILVAFDGSDSARNALAQAIGLARAGRSWIRLLAVVPGYDGDVNLTGVDEISEVMRGPIEAILKEADAIVKNAGVPVLSKMQQGKAYSEIVDVAEEENCDLIVMGRKGRRSVERMLMGGVTAQVVASSRSDVLIVPQGVDLGHETIVYALHATSQEATMRRAIELARTNKSLLHAISVVDMYPEFYAEAPQLVEKIEKLTKESLESFKSIADSMGYPVETTMRRGIPHEEIVDYARELEAGAILVGHSEKNGMVKIVSGDIVGKVIGFSDCPVFVLSA